MFIKSTLSSNNLIQEEKKEGLGIKKRNELCLKHRTQIYNQIIERFNLNDYLP